MASNRKWGLSLKKTVAATAVSCSLALTPVPAKAAICPPFAEIFTMLAQTGLQLAVEAFFQALVNTFTDQFDMFARLKISAQKVTTSQIATAGKAIINAEQQLAKGEVNSLGLLAASKEQLKVFQDYSAKTGQGVDPCGQLNTHVTFLISSGTATGLASQMGRDVQAAPGRFGDNLSYLNNRVQVRLENYASKDEVVLGYSKKEAEEITTTTGRKFSLAGADSNAETLFIESTDPRVAKAKDAYLDYLAGPPDAPIGKALASTPGGQQYLVSKMRKDAVVSTGLNSVARVAAENTPGHDGDPSMVSAMNNVVDLYYGDGAKERWRSWMSQSPRGLAVDRLKMSAASLALDAQRLEQARRIEANVGALLATQARKTEAQAIDSRVRMQGSLEKSGVR